MYDYSLLIKGINSPDNRGSSQYSRVTVCMSFQKDPGFRRPYLFDNLIWEPTRVDRYRFKSESGNGYTTYIDLYTFLN
jgi:hypothetical protein